MADGAWVSGSSHVRGYVCISLNGLLFRAVEGGSAACRVYDVEAQNRAVADLPRRSRFYQAKLDSKGTKGGNEEIKALLSYLRHSIIENVTDDATQSIHDSGYRVCRWSGIDRGKVG